MTSTLAPTSRRSGSLGANSCSRTLRAKYAPCSILMAAMCSVACRCATNRCGAAPRFDVPSATSKRTSIRAATESFVAQREPQRLRHAAREILAGAGRLRGAIDVRAHHVGITTAVRRVRAPHAPVVPEQGAAPSVLGTERIGHGARHVAQDVNAVPQIGRVVVEIGAVHAT